MGAGLTIAELEELLDPPMSRSQLFHLVRALELNPCGERRSGRPGRPAPCYDAKTIMEAHARLVPLLLAGSVGVLGLVSA
jgi:hypothetical protein